MSVILPDWCDMLCRFFWRTWVCTCVWENAHILKLYSPRNFTIKSLYIENRTKCHRTEFHLFWKSQPWHLWYLTRKTFTSYGAFCDPNSLNLILTSVKSASVFPVYVNSRYLAEVIFLPSLSSQCITLFNTNKNQVYLLDNDKSCFQFSDTLKHKCWACSKYHMGRFSKIQSRKEIKTSCQFTHGIYLQGALAGVNTLRDFWVSSN